MRKTKFRSVQKQMGKENKITFLMSILLTFMAFLSTQSHEQFHSLVAWAFGWTSSTQAGLLTGATNVIAPSTASLFEVWIFYMFPAIFIYFFIFWITTQHTSRFLNAMGFVIMALNIASFAPEINGSDAYNAMQYMITHGVDIQTAYVSHYIIFMLAILVYTIYIYLVNDNNISDVRRRVRTIF